MPGTLIFKIMKIQIEGNEKKVKQLYKELLPRCKRDKVELSVIEDTEAYKPENTVIKPEDVEKVETVKEEKVIVKKGRKAKK